MALRETGRLLDPDSAQDAAQEAVLRAWRAAEDCRDVNPEPWLRTIARREALRILGRTREVREADAAEPMDDGTPREPEAIDLVSCLRRLPAGEQHALLLRYWADQSDSEIAQRLGIPVGTVKIRIFRARKKLALQMGGG